ncbi:protein-export membrane protein SecF [Treponema primitia ZAS-2]|uniref:Protein-export membrane protein SecF n=1 Tax=Treponema primitia (strain ATCC BAA-887 / DSM 12427 / ZAS-2) TaxID=545694 RepID=F5YPF3_TREPZ|nr:protein translocase subunit SecF [Treponema primitia]AEF86762.1 protein-export membrane protein SecF [Treponema primitia ZAS-2]
MKIIRFSRLFVPTAIVSTVLIIGGLISYSLKGFNLGVDFQAGLIQEVQFAPTAFSLTYNGRGNASVSMDRNGFYIVISGSGVEGVTHNFPFTAYPSIGTLTAALSSTVDGIQVNTSAPGSAVSLSLVQSAQGNPQLGSDPYRIHYLPDNLPVIPIEDVRSALTPLGTVSVQVLGQDADRNFMIRMEDSEIDGGQGIPAEKIISVLEEVFGTGGVAVTRSDYVGSRFSKQLSDQAGILMALTLLLILIYASIRFKPQFAIGAVLAIAHDALIIVAFVTWTRMEFNTTTIAAILTILGYSINDTIVIFDRIRETRRIYPDAAFVDVLDRAMTETLSRTIITTLTTMLAVLSLFIFTTGSMKDFAQALLVGMLSGVYSTIFIASGFVNFWDVQAKKRAKKRSAVVKVSV